jgi:hypothetical protein
MDEDDIEYFWEDIEKVDNLDKCKSLVYLILFYRRYGCGWAPY